MLRPACRPAGAVLYLCILFGGCSPPGPEPAPPTQGRLRALVVLRGQFLGQHRGQPPRDEAEFRAFAEQQQASLASFDVKSVDELFVSDRDGEPFVINYSAAASSGPPAPTNPAGPGSWVAHERTGVGGKRWIALDPGQIEEVDEARLRELVGP